MCLVMTGRVKLFLNRGSNRDVDGSGSVAVTGFNK